jgi:hypothetical protein
MCLPLLYSVDFFLFAGFDSEERWMWRNLLQRGMDSLASLIGVRNLRSEFLLEARAVLRIRVSKFAIGVE